MELDYLRMVSRAVERKEPRSGNFRYPIKLVSTFLLAVLVSLVPATVGILAGIPELPALAIGWSLVVLPWSSWLILSEDTDFEWSQFRDEQPLKRAVPAYLLGLISSVPGYFLGTASGTSTLLTMLIFGFLSMHGSFVLLNREYYEQDVYALLGAPYYTINKSKI